MKKLVKHPRRFSSGGAIIKYEKPAGKMVLKRVLKTPVVKRSVKLVSKLPTRTRDFFLKNAPGLSQFAAFAKNALTFQSDDELRAAIDRQSDRQQILNRAEQIKKGTERNGFFNIVPGGVYTIYNPETFGVKTVKVQGINKKTDKVYYIDKDGFEHQTTPQMFFNMYSNYKNGWMDQSSTSSEPIITINTEGPTSTETPHIIIGSEPEPPVTPGSTQTVLEFPDVQPEPVVEEPAKTTLEVGQVFGNDGDKFTITQIDEDGKIHANRVKGDSTYTDLIYNQQGFLDELSYAGLSHEPIQSVVEEPVVEEKPESTVSEKPEGTTKITPTEEEVVLETESPTGQTQLTPEQISDAARKELNNKGILIDLLDNAEEGKNVYSQNTGKIHRYTKNKKGELVLSKGSRIPTKNEQVLIDKIFEKPGKTEKTIKIGDKWWKWPAWIVGTEALVELGTQGAVGTLDAIGAAALDEDWKEGFSSGWGRGRNKTLSHLLTNAIRAYGIRSYRESHNMMPDDWKDFINYYERNHANTFMKWQDDNGIYGDDVYTKSWENQEMKNAYNTWKNGNQ